MCLALFSDIDSTRYIRSKAPKGHNTGTLCRPDLIASTQPIPFIQPIPDPDWVNLEAVVAGASEEEKINQVEGYTGYLLVARPDRVAMLDLYIFRQRATRLVGCWNSEGVVSS